MRVITGRDTVAQTATFSADQAGGLHDLADQGSSPYGLRREGSSSRSDDRVDELTSLVKLLRSMSRDPGQVSYADVLGPNGASDRLGAADVVAPGNPRFENGVAPSFFTDKTSGVGYLRPLRQGDSSDFNVSKRPLHNGFFQGSEIQVDVHVTGRLLDLAGLASPATPAVGQTATLHVDTGGPLQDPTYDWDFGGGVHSVQASPTHVFTRAGSIPVTVSVQDDQGSTGQTTFYVQVGPKPTPSPSASPTDGAGTRGGKHDPVHGPNDSSGSHEGASPGTSAGTGPLTAPGAPTASASPPPGRGRRHQPVVRAGDEVVGTLLLASATSQGTPAPRTTADAAAAARAARAAHWQPSAWFLLGLGLATLLVLGGMRESPSADELRRRWHARTRGRAKGEA